jgi:hypothetical protein
MEPCTLLLCLQKYAILPFPEPVEYSPYLHITECGKNKISFAIILRKAVKLCYKFNFVIVVGKLFLSFHLICPCGLLILVMALEISLPAFCAGVILIVYITFFE